MKKKPDNNIPREEEFQRYLDNKMSERERYEFERRLQASDFYSDVEEGLSTLSAKDLQKDIVFLKNHLHKARKPNYILKIAATILLIAIASWIIIEQVDFNKPSTMESISKVEKKDLNSQTEEEPESADNIFSDTITAHQEENGFLALNESPEAEEDLAPVSAPQKAESAPKPVDQVIEEHAPKLETEVKSEIAEEDAEIIFEKEMAISSSASDYAKKSSQEQLVAPVPDTAMGLKSTIPTDMRTIRGKVMGEEDHGPLAGVHVFVKGMDISSKTNKDGFFKIEIPDSNNFTLSFSSIGMETTTFDVGNYSEYIEVFMSDDLVQLSEVVITKNKQFSPSEVINAQPANGYKEFRDYLKKNLRYPEGHDTKEVVHLVFTVEHNGNITNINILDSPNEAFSREAKRLILEGPQWKPATIDGQVQPEVIKIKIRFKRND